MKPPTKPSSHQRTSKHTSVSPTETNAYSMSRSEAALVKLFADRAQTADPPLWKEEFRLAVDNGVSPSLEALHARVAAAVMRGVQQTLLDCKTNQAEHHHTEEEYRRLVTVARRLRTVPQVRDKEAGHLDLYLWILSMYLSGKVLEATAISYEEGDRLAGRLLSRQMLDYPWFFLGQWWVKGLIGYWLRTEKADKHGRVRKLDDVFYGPANTKGVRRGRTQLLKEQRVWAIYWNVARLLAAGVPRKVALIDTTAQLNNGDLGTFTPLKALTVHGITRKYYEGKRTIDALLEKTREAETRLKQWQEEALLATQ